MPRQSEAQIIGDSGELWFHTQLPPGWILQRPSRDVGVDGVIVICEPGPLNGREFRVQIKSSKQFRIAGSAVVIPGVKRSAIDYWFVSPLPTMVVAYDLGRQQGYYRWHSDMFDELSWLQSDTDTQTVSITIPTQNVLEPAAWESIRQAILWHDRNLRAAFRDARDAKSVLSTIRRLAAAARQLDSIDHQPIPESQRTQQQQGLLALMEMIQHRDIISAASRLLGELVPECEGAARLRLWIAEYHDGVIRVFPTFDQLPKDDSIPPDFEIAYAPDLVHTTRPILLRRALELIMLLTPSGEPAVGPDEGATAGESTG